ncbi:MAG: DUF935 domain-containing protein [Pseudomonadota bacterium]
MALLDQHGRPIRRQELKRTIATTSMVSVRQPFPESIASGLTPERMGAVFRDANQGNLREYALLADEMEEYDPHYAAVLGTRKRAVSGVEATVEPASDSAHDKKLAELIRTQVTEAPAFAQLVEDMLDALGKGYSVVELDWATTADSWSVTGWQHVPAHHITLDQDTGRELRLVDEADPVNGIALAPGKFVVHCPHLKSGPVQRGGLARLVAFSWICKQYSIKDWMAFVEVYGQPLRVGKYDQSATQDDVNALFTAVANIGSDAGAVIPKSTMIEFIETSGSRSQAVFENLARYLDEQISKGVLGQTMTSDDGSSQAQANVHNEVRHDIANADAKQVAATLNGQLVRPIIDLNHGPQNDYPLIKIEIEEAEDVAMILEATGNLVAHGLRVKQSEVRARMGYTDPDPDDDILGTWAKVSDQTMASAVAAALADRDDIEELRDDMLGGWQPVMDDMLRPVREAIEGAASFNDALTQLSQIDNLNTGLVIDELVRGMFKARAAGDDNDG